MNPNKYNISINETHIVPKNITPIRLQEYGVGIFVSAYTKSALKKMLKKQYITVNNEIASTATFIKGGETITLSILENTPKNRLIFKLDILYEDDYLAVIHKPAGILVSGNGFKTITNALLQNLKESNCKDAVKPQPVHRLDYPTTGILLIGKTSSSIRLLNKLFENKEIKKIYYAVTIGKMGSTGTINNPVDDKPATSTYKIIETVPSKRFGLLNLVKLSPKTGRRHQLRKHLAEIGNPILGDKEYGVENLVLKGKGLYLHAYSLTFKHPFTGKELYFTDNTTKRFDKIFSVRIE